MDGWIGAFWAMADGAALYGGRLTEKKTHEVVKVVWLIWR
jgi:hypothetical protein